MRYHFSIPWVFSYTQVGSVRCWKIGPVGVSAVGRLAAVEWVGFGKELSHG